MAQAVQINPRMLSWARETAGLSPEEAAAKLGLKATAKLTAAEKLLEAERGARPVSQSMLEKAVDTYRRPLVTFYLPQPPARADRGEDFRTGVGAASPREDAMLDALIRDVRARQQLLREALLEDEDTKPLPFVASSRIGEGAKAVASKIRATLGVTTAAQKKARDTGTLFNLLRAAAEQAGIYVLLLGDLGSYHSDISEEVFRGFALADDIAPFVVINDNDAAAARSFTLLHELAHIWIGASGVSGPLRGTPAHAVERFCNEVAGEFLLPPEALEKVAAAKAVDFNLDLALSLTDDIARAWNVSQGVATYRFLLNRWISDQVATEMFRAFADRWRAERQRMRETRGPDDRGPPPNVVRRARLGSGLLDTVRRALQDDTLTHTKAARILGVAPAAVGQLLRERQRAA
ncbi:MAG TPA: XRE family transcriptional regulator [Acetobacteraceae bacterium]|jgi:Zn-dependent peptidase ImmA (M78 family)/transcriptional regulator with XRE-family HTH domain|nr:XRE family transcriptional regulator [Acetobacteraceae bacterium]